ncbi:MAG: hypothetical protein R6U32_02170 [Candidatus Woesearchaeota archaeon]
MIFRQNNLMRPAVGAGREDFRSILDDTNEITGKEGHNTLSIRCDNTTASTEFNIKLKEEQDTVFDEMKGGDEEREDLFSSMKDKDEGQGRGNEAHGRAGETGNKRGRENRGSGHKEDEPESGR